MTTFTKISAGIYSFETTSAKGYISKERTPYWEIQNNRGERMDYGNTFAEAKKIVECKFN